MAFMPRLGLGVIYFVYFICNQFEVTTDEPETLKQAKAHFEVILSNLEDVSREFNLLNAHLTSK